MLTSGVVVAKFYLSIIDDVIENTRELFLDEGLEDCILDDLRNLWETKVMASKAMDDFRMNNDDSPNFVLQLPANYSSTETELPASIESPGREYSQNIHNFPVKNNSETVTTFSLPAGLSYPVQIPAGVTLQTASGQLYKVNVPVVVTQAPAGQQTLSQPAQKATEQREPPDPLLVSVQPNETLPQEVLPPNDVILHSQQDPTPKSPQTETGSEEALTETPQFKSSDIDDILKEVIAEEREKAARARNLAHNKSYDRPEAILGLELDYNYNELSDIIQLDGTVDSSDLEEEDVMPLQENDFLGMINAEALRALQEEGVSSDGNSTSSTSDSDGVDELKNIDDEDPLNSGDDVFEQDVTDLFDSETVIVCQYDKIHRSKNRWKFHLKDGVMCYGGRDYVFSKAVGEVEW
ncbi:TFIIA-alpha and beta-like factor isoform X2 [Corythoichthys intestinalis]|uniref:TFIIA-alpha and beta-like factor isoform X2 n=1 Tax=Corythoichthys intestinalis TaxID=161448 RepID=UPI0025A4CE59|nr:TFIIA-alpha and beta-like factor isoform X2 [Corythoichthys intestinalis]XP_061794284.1 TFIIA-alpha and beta-like factor [Nerophis lumbriciformis]